MPGRPSPYLPPVMADVVIDLSHHQICVDFARAKEAGIAAALLKASQGRRWVDPTFAERFAAAREAGLLVGAYHFLDGADPLAQAEHFLATVGEAAAGVPLALDLERNPGGASATAGTAARAARHIEERTGRPPVIYVGRWTLARPHPLLQQCPLWLPEYGNRPVCPPGWRRWRLWQYTDGRLGRAPLPVPGIGPCDRSRFAGSAEDLAAWWLDPSG